MFLNMSLFMSILYCKTSLITFTNLHFFIFIIPIAPVSYPTIQNLKSASKDVTAPYFSAYITNSVLLEIIKTFPSEPPIINTYEL